MGRIDASQVVTIDGVLKGRVMKLSGPNGSVKVYDSGDCVVIKMSGNTRVASETVILGEMAYYVMTELITMPDRRLAKKFGYIIFRDGFKADPRLWLMLCECMSTSIDADSFYGLADSLIHSSGFVFRNEGVDGFTVVSEPPAPSFPPQEMF